MHRLDKAARDRKPKAGAGADMIALLRAIELVEHAFELRRRDAACPRRRSAARLSPDPARSGSKSWCRRGAYLAALSSRLNSTCSNSTASSSSIGRSAAEFQRYLVMRQDLAGAPQRTADDLADIVRARVRHDRAGFELGHVEQIGDEAIEPLGFVDHGREQIALLASSERPLPRSRMVLAAPSTEASGVLRSCEIEVSSADAQPVGFHRALDPVHVLDQQHALDRERALIDQRVEQTALVRRQQRPGAVVVDTDDADRRRARSASAGTAAWRPAACPSRARRGDRCSRPSSRRQDRPRRAGLPADSRLLTVSTPSSGSSSTTRTFSISAVW